MMSVGAGAFAASGPTATGSRVSADLGVVVEAVVEELVEEVAQAINEANEHNASAPIKIRNGVAVLVSGFEIILFSNSVCIIRLNRVLNK